MKSVVSPIGTAIPGTRTINGSLDEPELGLEFSPIDLSLKLLLTKLKVPVLGDCFNSHFGFTTRGSSRSLGWVLIASSLW